MEKYCWNKRIHIVFPKSYKEIGICRKRKDLGEEIYERV